MIWLIGGGVAALLVIAAAGWASRRRRAGRVGSPEEAAQAAESALPDFTASGAVVGADGAGALAVDARGRVAVMRRRGRGIRVREVAWSEVRATAEGIVIDTGDRRFGAVALAGVDALDIRRLSQA
jgi:hypothetical protein